VLPAFTLRERGYKGRSTSPTVSSTTISCASAARRSKTRICRRPVVVAKDLPDSNPIKKVALDFSKRYEDANARAR